MTSLSPLSIRLLLFGALIVLVLAACGSATNDLNTETASPATAALPTAIPTTPPLSLPPADDTLPALAALPETVPPVTAASSASAEETVEVSPVEPDVAATADPVPSATPAAVTDESVEVAPTAVAAEPQLAAAATDSVAVQTINLWTDCELEAAQTANATVLLDPIAQAVTTDLNSVQLNSLGAAAASCDIVASNLIATDLGDHVATASSCLTAWLGSSGGGSVFVGLTSIGLEQPTPVWAQTHTIDALDACFTGASFAGDVLAEVAADPSLAGAFDADCLAASFDSSGTLRSFAQSLVADPAGATLYVSLADAWVLTCANAGQMVAAAAAADGVALSATTISCIDAELKRAGVLAQLVAGTADADVVGIATLACMTDAEAAALLG